MLSTPTNCPPNLIPPRVRNEELSTQNFSPPIIFERFSRGVAAMALSTNGLCALLKYSSSIADVRRRLTAATGSADEKKFGAEHIWGASLVGYFLARVTNTSVDVEKAVLLSLKTTLAIVIMDHFVDQNMSATKDAKVTAISQLRKAFTEGQQIRADGQLHMAYELAEEVHKELSSSIRFGHFVAEINTLASAITRQLHGQPHSLAESVVTGSRSLGALAAILLALDVSLPTRFLKAARHFGVLVDMADDVHDAERDQADGYSTFASQLITNTTAAPTKHPVVKGTFIRHAKRCMQCLTVPERDVYRTLWHLVRLHYSTPTIEFKDVNPPIAPNVIKGLTDRDPSRAVSDHGQYWGPLFMQPRIGRNGRQLMIYKFRTMRAYDNDRAEDKQDVSLGKAAVSSRSTLLGRFLRRYFLDELPQFVNFVRGDFGVIGIRPQTVYTFNRWPLEIQAHYLSHGPAAINVLYGFQGSPNTDDPSCDAQRNEYLLNFYQEYEKAKVKTIARYVLKVAWNILVNGRRGM